LPKRAVLYRNALNGTTVANRTYFPEWADAVGI